MIKATCFFIEIIRVYCHNHRKGMDKLCSRLSTEADGAYSYQSTHNQYLTEAEVTRCYSVET